ncbi:MAG: thrombospondin type 3 repeat-containing protein [Bdellovibrionales bacterium]|nr:thrombospondin type 3 repeat-containing protein [Bdellovibrionales bacterium]
MKQRIWINYLMATIFMLLTFSCGFGGSEVARPVVMNLNADDDHDGILNGLDNCPNTVNADQMDSNNNGVGDACEYYEPLVAPMLEAPAFGSEVGFSWTDANFDEDGFKFQRKELGDANFFTQEILAPDTLTYSDNSLVPGVTYIYRVVVFRNSDDTEAVSNEISVTTSLANNVPPSGIPEILSVRKFNDNGNCRIEIIWQDNSTNESKFQIERQYFFGLNSSTVTTTLSRFNESAVESVAAGSGEERTYVDNMGGIPTNAQGIKYRVRASNNFGHTEYTEFMGNYDGRCN